MHITYILKVILKTFMQMVRWTSFFQAIIVVQILSEGEANLF